MNKKIAPKDNSANMPNANKGMPIDNTTRPKAIEAIEAISWQERQMRRLWLNLKMPRKGQEGALKQRQAPMAQTMVWIKILQFE